MMNAFTSKIGKLLWLKQYGGRYDHLSQIPNLRDDGSHQGEPSTWSETAWSRRNSRSALTRSRLPHRCSTPTTPLLCLIPMAMAARVKNMIVIMATITARVAEATAATVAAMLPTKATKVKATRARAASPALPHVFYSPSKILGLRP
jgi:hypothetical protein